MDKELLIDLLIWMDLTINSTNDCTNIQGLMAIRELSQKHKEFSDPAKRKKLISDILINLGVEND